MSWFDYLNPVRWFIEEAASNPVAEHSRIQACGACRRPGHNVRTCADLAAVLDRLAVVEAELAQERQRSANLSEQNLRLAAECERLRHRYEVAFGREIGEMMTVSSGSWRNHS